MRTPEESELHPQHRREEVVDPHDPSVRVAVTAISLADSPDGSTNDDVHVYRTAGPGSDPEVGLPPARAAWITARGDVEPYVGRPRDLLDDGRSAVRRGEASRAWRARRSSPACSASARARSSCAMVSRS